MNTSLFIAKRLYNAKENNNSYTRPIIRIAILAVALSVSIMLLSVFILSGFKAEISDKVFGFGGHVSVTKFSYNQSYENDPINYSKEIVSKIESIDDVENIQQFATKAGIIKKEEEILGVIIKGVGQDYNWKFFENWKFFPSCLSPSYNLANSTQKMISTSKVVFSAFFNPLTMPNFHHLLTFSLRNS